MTDQQVERLRQGIDQLREAALLTARRLDEGPSLDALAVAELLTQRLDRGVDHTVVALSGGTGSGKSSLFNAVAEMTFSEVGVIRPTTCKATACVWGTGAEDLLEWLGVERDAWIKRDSILESHIGDLRGLILLDLPDYDSASQDNRVIADRALPLADVLVWVTDPQKYADPALYERFVASARAHQGRVSMVVLNQIDTISEANAERISEALASALIESGVREPVVVLTSAKTGDGIEGLREALMERTAHRTMAMLRTAADLATAARQLGMASEVTEPNGRVMPDLAAGSGWVGKVEATTVKTLVEAIIGTEGVVVPEQPDARQIRQATSVWAAGAAYALPDQWALAVGYSLASVQNIAARLKDALESVEVPPPAGFWARLFTGGKTERRRRADLENAVRAAVGVVVDRTMARPTQLVLDERRKLADLVVEVALVAESGASRGAGGGAGTA
ncbi:MAG: 50S ribosome-binding GTPase [Bifidobacteriaceae bacterium]|jgi:GTPase Era involved in 16S rRNA processing|nr:50S ribosome-binding GTPase [Bifidobacteriaceae bacterium]